MLGRQVRLGITFPEIYRMQIRAIEAAAGAPKASPYSPDKVLQVCTAESCVR
jgi:hypothetical protein